MDWNSGVNNNILSYWRRLSDQPWSLRVRTMARHTFEYLATRFYQTNPRRDTVDDRQDGISALVRTHNEIWIQPSIRSIDKVVDEIVIVDSSTDDTTERIEEIQDELDSNIIHVQRKVDLHEATNIALDLSTKKWVLKWDGDFIARTNGTTIRSIYEEVRGAAQYPVVSFPLLSFAGDLSHLTGHRKYHIEPWLFKYSDSVEYRKSRIFGFEYLYYPKKTHKKYYVNEIPAIHLHSVKPPRHYLLMRHQPEWQFLSQEEKDEYESMEKFLEEVALRENEHIKTRDELAQAGRDEIERQIVRADPYDVKEFFPLPQEILDFIEYKGMNELLPESQNSTDKVSIDEKDDA